MFLVLTDENLVTTAFNLDHVVAVALTDAGRTTGQPLISLCLHDGTLVRHLRIPVPDEVRNPANVNAAWTHRMIAEATAAFFERIAGRYP